MQLPSIAFTSLSYTFAPFRPRSLAYAYGDAPQSPRRARPAGILPKPVSRFTGTISPELTAAREHMRKSGWSYRSAADALGCSHSHLALVVTGHRTSHSLLARIQSLPIRSN